MKRLTLFLIPLLAACAPKNMVVTPTDTTATEVRHTHLYIPDTVTVTLPGVDIDRQTTDSVSVIETGELRAEARLLPDGSLRHSLRTITRNIEVPVYKEVIRTDTIYRERKTIPVAVSAPKRNHLLPIAIAVALIILLLIIKRSK